VHFSYKRYLVNQIRRVVDFEGVPILINVKKRESNTKGKVDKKKDDFDIEMY
jgi:predicted GTPase